MQLDSYVALVRKSWIAILVCCLLGLGAAAALDGGGTASYSAETSLYISLTHGSSVSELAQGSAYTQTLMSSYVDVATSPSVLDPVISKLGLTMSTGHLKSLLTVHSPTGTVILDITATTPLASQAAAIANAVGDQVESAVGQLSPTVGTVSSTTKPLTVTTVAAAQTPKSAIPTHHKRSLILGLIGGLVLGLLISLLRQLLGTKVSSADAIDLITDAPIVGSVGPSKKQPLIVSGEEGPRAESFRRLRTNLLAVLEASGPVANGSSHRSLVVTSPTPGNGKTTTAVNLGIVAAETGLAVLLIDADLRSPGVAGALTLPTSPGLSEVLSGTITLDQAVQSVNGSSLCVVAAGIAPRNIGEVLGSDAMLKLLDEVTQQYDFVVIDAASLVPVTDPTVLALHTDGALVIVDARRSTKKQLAAAVGILDDAGARLVGVSLNRVRRRSGRKGSYQIRRPATT